MLQSLALGLYRGPLGQALLRSASGERAFEEAYFLYKRLFEARHSRHLRGFASGGDWIVDVVANIGFYCVLFAGWLDHGTVLAIEPEADNFRRLQKIIARRKLGARVEAWQAALGERRGTGRLAVSKESHADHRLGDDGIPVALETLDGIWREVGRPDIHLIKIDVQGGERGVLLGAEAVLAACRPPLYVEVDASGGGGNAGALLGLLDALGYRPHAWRGRWTAITGRKALAAAARSSGRYTDYLFLPK